MRILFQGLSIFTLVFSTVLTVAQENNIAQGEMIVSLDVPDAIQVEWNYDLSKLAILTGEQIQIWDTEIWQLSHTISPANVYSFAWHPNENILAGVRGGRHEELTIWNGDTGELEKQIIRQIPEDTPGIVIIHSLSWSPDGSQIVSDSTIDTITIWDLDTETYETLVPAFDDTAHNIVEISWSQDGDYLLSGAIDDTVRIWNVANGEEELRVEGYKYIAWHPNQTHFAAAGFDTSIMIWDFASGQEQLEFSEHTNTITSISWNFDGQTLSSTDADGNLLVWEFSTANIAFIDLPNATFVVNTGWRPDGLQLAIVTRQEVLIVNW